MSRCTKAEKIFKNGKRVSVLDVKGIDLKKSNFERKPSKKFMEVTLNCKDIKKLSGGKISGKKLLKKRKIDYPKKLYGHINVANFQEGATLPKKVGKVHTLFKTRKFRNLNEWKKWYTKKYPNSIKEAVDEILGNFKTIGISASYRRKYKPFVEAYVENLLLDQTYQGLTIQEIILRKLSQITGKKYVWSSSTQDSGGTDGFVGEIPVSIKPKTCSEKKAPGVKRAYYKINENKNIIKFEISL